MQTDQFTDAEAFYRFLGDQIENGGREKSPEELVRLWRLLSEKNLEKLANQNPPPQEWIEGEEVCPF